MRRIDTVFENILFGYNLTTHFKFAQNPTAMMVEYKKFRISKI